MGRKDWHVRARQASVAGPLPMLRRDAHSKIIVTSSGTCRHWCIANSSGDMDYVIYGKPWSSPIADNHKSNHDLHGRLRRC